MRTIALTIMLATIGLCGAIDHADAGKARRAPKAAECDLPTPPIGWPWFCDRNDCTSAFPCRAAAISRYDDAWCSSYGPPGSYVYAQCRENLYIERIELPLRDFK